MDAITTPVAIFAYNRPDHVQSALASLAKCRRLSDCRLTIYCDGPKTPALEAGVAATRRVVRDWASRLNAEVIERGENLGLARSIVSGVTEQCQKFGRTIVVEDDLVVSPDFLDYMLQGLEHYQDTATVYQISGFMFPVDHPAGWDAFFLPLTTTWGWATWERAWRVFDWNASSARHLLADLTVRKRFNLNNSYPYFDILTNRLAGRNDSWGILWWYAVFSVDGLVLHPRRSLVWNGGFDSTGIHAGAPANTMQSPREYFDSPRLAYPLTLPGDVLVDQEAFARVTNYLRTVKGVGSKSKMLRLFRKVKRTVAGKFA